MEIAPSLNKELRKMVKFELSLCPTLHKNIQVPTGNQISDIGIPCSDVLPLSYKDPRFIYDTCPSSTAGIGFFWKCYVNK